MVVNLFHNVGLENFANDMPRHMVAPGVSIAARQPHRGKIVLAKWRIHGNNCRRDIHPFFAAGNLQKVRG